MIQTVRGLIRDVIIIVVLIASTLAAYWPVREHQFVHYDDQWYIVANEHVKNGLTAENFQWAFTTLSGGYWHPLTWLSHMGDVQLFGMNPAGHHFMAVAIHILNVIVLFLMMRSMTGVVWPSAVVAGLFALHPLRVESVAWAAERKDVLSVLFGLLTIWAYAAYARRQRVGRYMLVLVCYALSLLCKPMLVTLPFLLLVLDFWPLRRIGVSVQPADGIGGMKQSVTQGPGWSWPIARRLILEKLPLLVMAIAISVVTFKAQKGVGAMHGLASFAVQSESSIDEQAITATNSADLPSLWDRFGNAVVSYVRYLGKTFWPADLAVLYPHPGRWPLSFVLGSAALLAVVTGIAVLTMRRCPYLLVGWLWFIGTLVPVIGLVQVGVQSMADRYSYFPTIGVLVAFTWGVLDAVGQQRSRLLGLAALSVMSVLWVSTRVQLQYWRDTRTLYEHAVNVTRDNYVMNLYLAIFAERDGRVDDALNSYREAARIRPTDPILQFKVSELLARQGKIPQALAGFRNVLALDPNQVQALNNLAWYLATHVDQRLRNGAEAVSLAQRACDLTGYKDPDLLDTLAAAFAEAGKFDDAVATAQRARSEALAVGRPVSDIDEHIRIFSLGLRVRSGEVVSPAQISPR
jgi:hypothetical protein